MNNKEFLVNLNDISSKKTFDLNQYLVKLKEENENLKDVANRPVSSFMPPFNVGMQMQKDKNIMTSLETKDTQKEQKGIIDTIADYFRDKDGSRSQKEKEKRVAKVEAEKEATRGMNVGMEIGGVDPLEAAGARLRDVNRRKQDLETQGYRANFWLAQPTDSKPVSAEEEKSARDEFYKELEAARTRVKPEALDAYRSTIDFNPYSDLAFEAGVNILAGLGSGAGRFTVPGRVQRAIPAPVKSAAQTVGNVVQNAQTKINPQRTMNPEEQLVANSLKRAENMVTTTGGKEGTRQRATAFVSNVLDPNTSPSKPTLATTVTDTIRNLANQSPIAQLTKPLSELQPQTVKTVKPTEPTSSANPLYATNAPQGMSRRQEPVAPEDLVARGGGLRGTDLTQIPAQPTKTVVVPEWTPGFNFRLNPPSHHFEAKPGVDYPTPVRTTNRPFQTSPFWMSPAFQKEINKTIGTKGRRP